MMAQLVKKFFSKTQFFYVVQDDAGDEIGKIRPGMRGWIIRITGEEVVRCEKLPDAKRKALEIVNKQEALGIVSMHHACK